MKNCKAAVSRYAKKWAKEESVDRCLFRDWKETVNKCIDEKIRCMLKAAAGQQEKEAFLKSRVHLDNLKINCMSILCLYQLTRHPIM